MYIVKVPIMKNPVYTLYHILTLPVPTDKPHIYQTLFAEQLYLLMEPSYAWYGYLALQQLLKCKDINMNVKACKEKGQIQSVAKEKDGYVTPFNPTTKQLPEKCLENVHALRIDYLTRIP